MTNNLNYTEWTPELVADHFEEAVSTTRKLPAVKVQGYFCVWPDIIHTPNELMLQEPRNNRLRAMPDAIARLEQTFEWMQWLTIEERKLIWRRAARVPWKTICLESGYTRMTLWIKWMAALNKISNQLNRNSR